MAAFGRICNTSPDFDYPRAAEPGLLPSGILVQTVRSFPVSLLAHDVLPRTAEGHVIAKERAELKKNTGNEARVTARLVFGPSTP